MRARVIGGGPAGVSAAACLRAEGIPFRWLDETGVVGGAYRTMYGAITLASPARYNGLPGEEMPSRGEYVTAAEYLAFIESYAARRGLKPEKGRVESVAAAGGAFIVRLAGGGTEEHRAVVVATGMFGHPRRPEIAGLPAAGSQPEVLLGRDWPGPERFQGRGLLIIGRGMTGVEIAEECARAGLRVRLSARRGRVPLAPRRVLGRDIHDYAALIERLPAGLFRGYCRRHPSLPATDRGFAGDRSGGLVTVVPEVVRFEGRRAVCADGSSFETDAVVLAAGYRFDTPFLPEAVARAPGGHPVASGGESVSWPGLFFMGFPCARGLDSPFLRGMTRDAPRLARRVKERLS